MSRYACIILDAENCINCKACEVHCATWNGLNKPLGRHSGGLPYVENDNMLLPVEFFTCMHCKNPLCLRSCKLGAMFTSEDNMVCIDPEKCTGCGDCIEACPTKVPWLNKETGKVVKCDLCASKRAVGEKPVCVAGCTSHALTYREDPHVHKLIMKRQLKFIRQFGK